MLSKKEREKYPNYFLSTYQLEIYRQLSIYMDELHLNQSDIAKELKVSNSYVSQILNGNFNFTLKKLIELGLMMGKVPAIEFVSFEEYWRREQDGTIIRPTISINVQVNSPAFDYPLTNKIGEPQFTQEGILDKNINVTQPLDTYSDFFLN